MGRSKTLWFYSGMSQGFHLFSAALKIHPFLRFRTQGVFRHLRMPTRGLAPEPHFLFFVKKRKRKKAKALRGLNFEIV